MCVFVSAAVLCEFSRRLTTNNLTELLFSSALKFFRRPAGEILKGQRMISTTVRFKEIIIEQLVREALVGVTSERVARSALSVCCYRVLPILLHTKLDQLHAYVDICEFVPLSASENIYRNMLKNESQHYLQFRWI